jgi:hypothetical protein
MDTLEDLLGEASSMRVPSTSPSIGADEERRLGYFKVARLAGVHVTQRPFDALPNAGAMLLRAGDKLPLAVT